MRSEFSLTDFSAGKNVFVFEVDMDVSMHIANKGKNILILGKGPTQELDDIMLTDSSLKVQYWINFSRSNRKICLILHYNGSNSFLFVNATKIYQFKAKDSKLKKYSICLGNLLGDFSANIMKKTGLNGCVYNFSVDYKTFDTSDKIDIHKYLIKKHDVK